MLSQIDTQYPARHETKVILKDGSSSLFRPIRQDDVEGWLEFFNRLSQATKFLRLQYLPATMGEKEARRFCTVDYKDSFAFVAEAIENRKKRIVAIGRYNRLPSDTTAEIAFVIEDNYHAKGIGTKLIEYLATVARENQIDTFEAFVLPENKQMLSVFQGYGFHMTRKSENNVYHITFPLTKTPQVQRKKDERSLSATLNSLSHIMKPRFVAVIGASNQPGSLGLQVFQAVVRNNFSGIAYPITANHTAVMSVKAYPSVMDVIGPIDLGIIVVPSDQALEVVDECGRKGVKGIIVISDGFKERGPEGTALETQLRRTAFGYGMRIIGPNCMGLINTEPDVSLNATFAPISPLSGNIAFISQSGALGLGILKYALNHDIGFSSYISVGNQADIAATDMLQYWEKDPETDVILLYLESFDNPEMFSRVSRRVSGKKPILAVKGGSTAAGSRAAMTHTGAMATPDIVSDALFNQAGIIRVNTIKELFDTAILLARQPIPKGRRIAILTNGGGPGTLAADTCSRNGLELPELSQDLIKQIKGVIKRDISISNPVDLTAGVSAKEFEDTLRILVDSPDFDAVMTIYVPPTGIDTRIAETAIENVVTVANENGKPILACLVGQTASRGKMTAGHYDVPYYLFPEEASVALANAAKYSEIKNRKNRVRPEFTDIRKNEANKIINNVLTQTPVRPLWVPTEKMNEIFECYGIHTIKTRIATSPEQAGILASEMGFPVAVKLNSSTISHKSDVNGVVLDVNSSQEAEKAFLDIQNHLVGINRDQEMQGVTIQKMVKDALEVIVGVTVDDSLGHVIMFGLGGIYAELIKDTAVKLLPLTKPDAGELMASVKMINLLKGYRGAPASDIESLKNLLLRLSVLVENIPQITEIDLNPVKVLPEGNGYVAVDARIMIR